MPVLQTLGRIKTRPAAPHVCRLSKRCRGGAELVLHHGTGQTALHSKPQPLLLKSLPPPRPPSQTCILKASFQHISARLLLSKPAVIISNQQNCCNDARLKCQG